MPCLKGDVYSLFFIQIKLKVKGYRCPKQMAQTGKPVSSVPGTACCSVPQGCCFCWAASQAEGSSESEAVHFSDSEFKCILQQQQVLLDAVLSCQYITSWHKGWHGKPSYVGTEVEAWVRLCQGETPQTQKQEKWLCTVIPGTAWVVRNCTNRN